MAFDNADFQRGAAATLKTLEDLKKGLKLDGAAKGLDELGKTASRFSMAGMVDGVSQVTRGFSTLGVVAISALATIASKATTAGLQLAKSFTSQPIVDGLREYETNLNSIQTILANTGLEGQRGLDKVNHALQELNEYSDKTIYNFSEMARNIGTFTAAGVDLKTSTAAIKGIANLAAISGSNSQQASTAMYQLSQALAAGKVSLIDWNSVVNAGMGGKVFQEALKETARTQGVAIDDIIKKNGSFRDSLQDGWLTSSVLTETLSKFTGDLTAAQLKTMGYNEEQIKGILKMGKTAQDAATKVKTFSQLMSTLQEAAGSGWSKTWQLIFGDFEEARTLFTGVSNVLGGFINASSDARNKVLADWKELGGRKAIIDAIGNSFEALIAFVKPIGQAFRDIFPPVTGKRLADISKSIEAFTRNLKIGGTTANNLRRTFAGVFAIFDIGLQVINEVIGVFARLFGVAFEGSGSFLETTASIGDFIVGLDKALKSGEGLGNFFDGLGDILEKPIRAVKKLLGFLLDLSEQVDLSPVGDVINSLMDKLASISDYVDGFSSAWDAFFSVLGKIFTGFAKFGSFIADIGANIGDSLSSMFEGVDIDTVLSAINTGLLAGAVLIFKRFTGGILGALSGGGEAAGLLDTIKDAFGGVTDALSTMQNTLRATTLLQIAAAIALLVVSINTLSKIEPEDLAKALAAITATLGQLFISLIIFEKIAAGGLTGMGATAAAFILLAIAVNILADAVEQLSGLSWEELAKGLTGTTVLLAALAGTAKLLQGSGPGMITASIGLLILSGAIKVLASAVKDMSDIGWEELAKGLVGVGTLLGALGLFTKFAAVNKGAIAQGAGLILLATAIKILASAVNDFGDSSWQDLAKGLSAITAILGAFALFSKTVGNPAALLASGAALVLVAASMKILASAIAEFGEMNWEEIGKGLTVMSVALLAIALALGFLPPTALLSAAAIFVVAQSLGAIGDAVINMSGMSWGEIAKGITVLAASLAIIAAALFLMSAALPGAAALIIVAGALTLLVPVLQALGSMSWGEIAKALGALALTFVVLGAAGLLLGPVVPILLGLGAAVALLGVGLALAGVGVLAFSAGLAALAVSGVAGAAALVAIIATILGALPMIISKLGAVIVALAKAIGDAAPAIVAAIVKILTALMAAVIRMSPQIAATLRTLVTLLIRVLTDAVPRMVAAGLRIVIGILTGIRNNIAKIVTVGLEIIAQFINGVARGLPRVIQSGVNLIISFVNGLANAIRNNSAAMGAAGANLASAIVEGMARGLTAGVGVIAGKAREVARSALNAAKSVLGINSPSKEFEKIGKFVNEGFAKGLDGNKASVNAAFKSLKDQLSAAMKAATKDVGEAEAKLRKLTRARHKDRSAIRKATAELAQARKEQRATSAAYTELTKRQDKQRVNLGKLADQYDALGVKLKAAQQKLADATKTRDDFRKSITDQFAKLPEAQADSTLSSYTESLRQQIIDTQLFASELQRLRKLGLNDALYKELLAKGPSTLPFIQDILGSGKVGVDELNKLGKQLQDAAAGLGKTASTELYQAAVDSAAGLVKGLQNQMANIEKVMDKIAASLVTAIKKKLGIKSPSRVFQQIGEYTLEGLAKGLDNTATVVEKSAENVGRDAIFAMQKSLNGMSELIDGSVDMNPRITPVLDLSQMSDTASRIDALLGTRQLALTAGLRAAQDAQQGYTANQEALAAQQAAGVGDSYNFVQNNTSPKAISTAEVYRQTNNVLSRAKGVRNP